ncbi:MAG: DUF2852 domain-containing protein [Rhodospirillales bacterium]|nr:DUF2852 domain-containing protein [Rhodospirillales bacterium]
MASAANNETYGGAWGGPQAQAAPGGWGPGWQGQGPGWQSQGGQGPNGQGPSGGWSAPPFWYPAGISKPAAIAFTVLGFIFWWPVGLALLIYMVASGRFGCGRRRGWQMSEQSGGWQGPSWTPPWKAAWNGWCSGGGGNAAPSSGNRAFDEYRAETLRRLEEEQKEFGAFLDRLRVAKDKAEFDQFMADRRQRPPAPPTEPGAEHG